MKRERRAEGKKARRREGERGSGEEGKRGRGEEGQKGRSGQKGRRAEGEKGKRRGSGLSVGPRMGGERVGVVGLDSGEGLGLELRLKPRLGEKSFK